MDQRNTTSTSASILSTFPRMHPPPSSVTQSNLCAVRSRQRRVYFGEMLFVYWFWKRRKMGVDASSSTKISNFIFSFGRFFFFFVFLSTLMFVLSLWCRQRNSKRKSKNEDSNNNNEIMQRNRLSKGIDKNDYRGLDIANNSNSSCSRHFGIHVLMIRINLIWCALGSGLSNDAHKHM